MKEKLNTLKYDITSYQNTGGKLMDDVWIQCMKKELESKLLLLLLQNTNTTMVPITTATKKPGIMLEDSREEKELIIGLQVFLVIF